MLHQMAWADPALDVIKGNKSYKKGDYEKAREAFQAARSEKPSWMVPTFNAGCALYKQGKYAEALEDYRIASRAQDPQMKEKAIYNIGNVLFRSGKYAEALEAYKEALRLDPSDEDARHNYEVTWQKLKNEKKDKDKNKKDEKKKDQKKKEDRGDKSKSAEKKEKKRQDEKGSKTPQPKTPPEDITKQDALNLLKALESQDKRMKQKRRRIPTFRSGQEDW
jgi:tetratricopeptide (TPR) repeat protein